ncbi:MAG: right-handed parallel beta-helix repeat-containing protein, partial [Cytophagales bacterium]|nr:right-handed parallel beta-helix repeat-containing protein [Cytophagales bacterium]
CIIARNKIGTDITGTQIIANGWNTVPGVNTAGINLYQSSRNEIHGNLVSGNIKYGLNLFNSSNGNTITGNKIGTNILGTAALPNGIVRAGQITDGDGINIYASSSGTIIGGESPQNANLISGNGNGIVVQQGSYGTTIYGNLIGTDITGQNSIPNNNGIYIASGSGGYKIGGSGGKRNIISGNLSDGISIESTGGNGFIQNNLIGIGINQTTLPNGFNGITLRSEYNNVIGGNPQTESNFIYFSGKNGIELLNSSGTFISGNNFRGNGNNGVIVSSGSVNKITQNIFQGNQNKAININLGTAIQGNNGWKSPLIKSATFSNDLSSVLIKGISFTPQDIIEIFSSNPSG